MIRAKELELEDRGFFAGTKKIGGVVRQTLTIALAGGLDDAALAALKEGPLTVLDQDGEVTASFSGPMEVLSLQLVLAREDPAEDVAALEAQMAELQTAFNEVESARESAEAALQKVQEMVRETKAAMQEAQAAQNADVDQDRL